MIVILSYTGDQVTNKVIEWLQRYECKFKRVHLEEEDFRNISLELNDGAHTLKLKLQSGELLNVNEVSCFFFRGGLFPLHLQCYVHDVLPASMIANHLAYERNTLVRYFYKEVSRKCLGNLLLHPLNKLEQLRMAAESGLAIPETVICNSKEYLQESLLKDEKCFITKSIQENVFYQAFSDVHYELKVNELHTEKIDHSFFPSLFQKSIEKAIEIRTFYLDGKFYSLAMLLFAADKRVVDYRTATKQIRYACYQLPDAIENKLQKMMNVLNLNTGSIDLVLGKDGEYYFLELNPTGQVGWVSDYGGYNIEEKIATYLLTKQNKFINEQQASIAS